MISEFETLLQKTYALALVLLILPGQVLACSTPGEVPRTILALYDGDRVASPRHTRVHRFAEMPLNHLGFRLLYRDVTDPGSPVPEIPLAGTISWFDGPVPEPKGLAAFLGSLRDTCGKTPALLVLGHTGLTDTAAASEEGAAYLSRLGIAHAGNDISIGPTSTVERINPALVGTETAFNLPMGTRSRFLAIDDSESELRAKSGATTVDLLVLANRSIYADNSTLVRVDPRGGTLWVSDPFELFGHALAHNPWPVPDTTTLSGRRMYFSTVGSEGWLSRLPARQFGDQPPFASEVLDASLITPYPDLPFSVAPLAGDLDAEIAGPSALRAREVASHLFSLPHVQAGTTGYSLIQNWDFFDSYDAQTEEELLASGARRNSGEGIVQSAMQNLSGAFSAPTASALDITPFAPRKYPQLAFDLANETSGAVRAITELAPTTEELPLFVWSGNAMPFAAAIAQVSRTGARNIGGGGGLVTATRPSLSQLWPLGFETEAGVQVYNALSSDAAYTNFWTGDLYAFLALRQTLDRTEEPRRLKPFQLSFSARSAVDFATRSAVRRHLDFARTAELTGVSAARYSATVEGFYSYRAIALDARSWRIEDRGELQTVRFDDAAGHAVDLGASQGVLGARRKDDSLYVALNPNTVAPVIVLEASDVPLGLTNDEARPALVQARAEVLSFAHEDCTNRGTALGFGDAEMEWAAIPEMAYQVTLYEDDGITPSYWETVQADAEGRLSVVLQLPPGRPTLFELSHECPEG